MSRTLALSLSLSVALSLSDMPFCIHAGICVCTHGHMDICPFVCVEYTSTCLRQASLQRRWRTARTGFHALGAIG